MDKYLKDKVDYYYSSYEVYPFISEQRNIEEWLKEVDLSKSKLVPKRNMEILQDKLLAGHIILLWRVGLNTYTTGSNICKYFEYTYGIDAVRELENLIAEGYVRKQNAFECIDLLNLGQLKMILKKKNINGISKMKKQELVIAVSTEFSLEELNNLYLERRYELTAAGKDILSKYNFVIDRHPQKKIYK